MALPAKLLIANRGEIAIRIIRTARAMGIATVAVYSEDDAAMPHVVLADEAIAIESADAASSYLNIAGILNAAAKTGADAIHPGYGFLSERPEFARAVVERGLLFIGPPADVMAALGDKVAARRLAVDAGVPVVPGLDGADIAAARDFAARNGFPILIKAAAGGGGRGMRVVQTADTLEVSLEAAAREAAAAFGDGRLFIEKYIARPRHVELQVIADNHGNTFTLGERDCSIQRRHQKIVEESPAPGLPDNIRIAMAEAAVKLFGIAGYRNAGTAEFLLDGDAFYFLEANTRLQVEHPVTEMRFGCDLVAMQIHIAAGEPLVEPMAPRGHAIEVRICAEDAEHDFRPAAGRVIHLNLPAGLNVRMDTYLAPAAQVSPLYDSLLGKLVVWGANREEARHRLIAALDEFMLSGVHHTAAFLREVVASEAFADAQLSTRFIAEFFPNWRPSPELLEAALIAAAIAPASASTSGVDTTLRDGALAPRSPWETLGGFELWGRR